MPAKTYAVFLSFNSEDRAEVEWIAAYLTDKANLRPWLDQWELIPGEPWVNNLERGLEASSTCAVFVGKSGEGPWQKREVELALRQQIQTPAFRVIPVLLPDAPKQPKLPSFLAGNMWVAFEKGLDDPESLWRLTCGIRGISPGRGPAATLSPPQKSSLLGKIKGWFSGQEQEVEVRSNVRSEGFSPLERAEVRTTNLTTNENQNGFLSRYRNYLKGDHAYLKFKGLSHGHIPNIALNSVHIALKAVAGEGEQEEQAFDLYKSDQELEQVQRAQESVRTQFLETNFYQAEEQIQHKLAAEALLSEYPRLVIVGEPGSGKTTLVEYLLLELVEKPQYYQERLGLPHPPLPLFLQLRNLPSGSLPTPDRFKEYCLPDVLSAKCPPGFFEQAVEGGQCVIFLDGLDEVTLPEERRKVARWCIEILEEEWQKAMHNEREADLLRIRDAVEVLSRLHTGADMKTPLLRLLKEEGLPEEITQIALRGLQHVGQIDDELEQLLFAFMDDRHPLRTRQEAVTTLSRLPSEPHIIQRIRSEILEHESYTHKLDEIYVAAAKGFISYLPGEDALRLLIEKLAIPDAAEYKVELCRALTSVKVPFDRLLETLVDVLEQGIDWGARRRGAGIGLVKT